jgi:hypothetical protein
MMKYISSVTINPVRPSSLQCYHSGYYGAIPNTVGTQAGGTRHDGRCATQELSYGTRTDYSMGPWDYPTCAARYLMA